MEYKWFRKNEDKPIGPKLQELMGSAVVGSTVGEVETGEMIFDSDKGVMRPETRQGFSITTKQDLTTEQLALLNKAFGDHERDLSLIPLKEGEIRDLEAELDELKAVPYVPLPGTGLPDKIQQIEDFLGQVFKE